MKNKYAFLLLYIAALIISLINTAFSLKNYLFADINELPAGRLVAEVPSPTGEKTVNVYLVKNSLGSAVRGELVLKSGEAKNVFWQTDIDGVNVTWGNEELIFFNDVPISGDGSHSYDCRRGTSLFTDGSLENDRLNLDDE